MASTLLLRRRIKTAQNVSKTTKAMQMIAASKLKRAQDATLASRPYVSKLSGIGKTLSERIDPHDINHPFLQLNNQAKKKLLIVFAPDKGLCGPLVTNLAREMLVNAKDEFVFVTVGKKIEGPTNRLNREIIAAFPFGTTLPMLETIYPIVQIIEEQYLSKKIASVHLLYTHFTSIFSQKPVFTTILPLTLNKAENNKDVQTAKETKSYTLFEPNVSTILDPLLKHYLEMSLYQNLLESFVSEQASRMIAMQNATDNAKEIVAELTLSYNKARQAKITSEILDISSSFFAYA